MLLIDVPLFFAATMSVANFYVVAQREIHATGSSRLKYLPFLMAIGIGLAVNNARAVIEALVDRQSEFARTPKYGIQREGDEWIGKRYRQTLVVQPLVELALGLYFTATVFYALANGIYGTLPFLMLFQVGFLYMGIVSVVQQYAGEQPGAEDGRRPDGQVAAPPRRGVRSRPSCYNPVLVSRPWISGTSATSPSSRTSITASRRWRIGSWS